MTTTTNSPRPTERRTFLHRLGAGLGALALAATPRALYASGAMPNQDPGDEWLKSLTGRHRTIFDAAAHRNGKPLAQSKNFLDAWHDAYAVPARDVNLVVGVHGEALPLVVDDATWRRFKLGEQYDIVDGSMKRPAERNVFVSSYAPTAGLISAAQSVEALQNRGVKFLVCKNTIAGATAKLAAAGLGTAEEIRPALLAGLLPGVTVVPAMVVALTNAQQRGFAYVKVA
jgi:intracellular sulfur oxidation DsrE/DsrF family protein